MTAAAQRYNNVAIALHWLMALAILFMLALGVWMSYGIEETSPDRFALYQLHKSIGIVILLLAVVRLVWRLLHQAPPLPAHMAAWEKFAAKASHYLLYALMFIIPLTGWAMVSASPWNIPTMLFGAVEWPHLPVLPTLENKKDVAHFFSDTHAWLAYGLAVLLVGHAGAALRHHFIEKDEVLLHMVPRFGRKS